jgi:hypothetical protein
MALERHVKRLGALRSACGLLHASDLSLAEGRDSE